MAGQAGQNSAYISAETPISYSPVVEALRALPGTFAFPQAVHIAESWMRTQGNPVSPESFRYSVNPSLAFPPGDINALEFSQQKSGLTQTAITLNLMGLHGAGSPLPAYFTEYVSQHADEQDALRDFFDMFNHRLIMHLYNTWLKYRYYAQYKPQATDKLSGCFFGFIGAERQETRKAKQLRWPRLMAYMGLIAFNGEASGSLESILRHYFSHETICIIPCINRWVAIPPDQQTHLGERNHCLGEDFIMGEEMPDQTGKFRIQIADLTWERFNSFLPIGKNFAELQTLVKFILRSRLQFDIELRLIPEEIRPWRLEPENECRLGWSVWHGEGADGVVVLETDYREL
ncbi:MAG: type VI secretion system baseplate subunit TssG [Desulfovibrio sp.]|jgi:type VI secretion system protein ImpH|nr:type VI secretion system baseplate subunit TssG [Desulfovibrio sp.]